jgi:hypothetical protein
VTYDGYLGKERSGSGFVAGKQLMTCAASTHAIHMAAVTQVSHRHSQGRAYYDKKLAQRKTPKEPCVR